MLPRLRHLVLPALVVGFTLSGVGVASASTEAVTTLTTPKLSEACTIPSFASAHYLIKSGHATSGTWTLAPRLDCTQPKIAMSIQVTLKRYGVAELSTSGRCVATTHLCHSAVAPQRSKSYTTAIRGTWTATVNYSVTGPDAVLFRSSPRAGTCTYHPTELRTSCHYDTVPVVIG